MTVFRGQHFMNFDEPAASPSAAAAARQTPAKVEGHKLQIMLVLERLGPLTDEDISKHTDLGLNTVRPRRGELVRDGLVVAVDDQGRTRTGSKATRWGRV